MSNIIEADGGLTDERTGPEKAAIFMLAAGIEHAGKLFDRLDFDEIKEVTQAMSALGVIPGEAVEATLHEFSTRLGQTGTLVGSFESAERILSRFFDEDRVSLIMDEIRGPAGRTVWDKLGNVNEAVLASYLKNEYPQTIAVVLSKVKPDHAARVLACLPDEIAIEAVMRMLRMEAVQKEIIKEVEKTLRSEFMTNLARTHGRDNHEIMAEIFNYLDRTTETRLLDMLEERNKESADKVRSLMFTFEDLVSLDGAGIQTLLRQVEAGKLAIALKGASEKLRDLFCSNMSQRAAKMLRDDMEASGPVRVRDVEEAQALMVNLVKELSAKGEIYIAENREEQMIV
jgi:flagellar motor switch protein FliG